MLAHGHGLPVDAGCELIDWKRGNAESGATAVRLYDLDSAAVTATYAVDNAPSALYTSPGGRYAVAVQRLQDKVQFIDGGIWQEGHVDHLHDYKQAPPRVDWVLAGVRPTHFDVQAGAQAAFFMDGNSGATPVQNAGVWLITDLSCISVKAPAMCWTAV